MSMLAAVIGRILIGLLFVVTGAGKIAAPVYAAGMLEKVGLPGSLALPTGIFEVCAGLMLAAGLATRAVAIVLAVFVAVTVFLFHNQLTDPVEGLAALKNIAIIGGLLVVFAYGHMRWDYDYMRAERRDAWPPREAEDDPDDRGKPPWWRY
ncbi:DoxX family protein [Altericroceibacterium xinjiangense]|uniref:DoxX family protein n=1 Tax=Altericroceibacterium xinjiangense TaxID=762261 RepID=UPI000F7E0811|nr:DoxX family protein [Altericroceibacterium xinjiangense]